MSTTYNSDVTVYDGSSTGLTHNNIHVGNFPYGSGQYYTTRANEVIITVIAETVYEAELKVNALVFRQTFELQIIKELRDE